MVNDLLNAFFEFAGAITVWHNVRVLLRDRKVRGVSLASIAFFTSWGFWNLYYYPSLGQMWSTAAGVFLCAGNLTWIVLALRWRNE